MGGGQDCAGAAYRPRLPSGEGGAKLPDVEVRVRACGVVSGDGRTCD